MSAVALDSGVPRGVSGSGARSRAAESADNIPVIELRNITRTFVTSGGVEVRALRGVDLKIHIGEFIAIVGQSGSGKSTMMNILGCLDKATSGTYLFAGRNIRNFEPDDLAWLRREGFGFVFQSYNLLPHSTAIQNVEIPAIYAGYSAEERRIRAEALLTSLGIGDRMDHRPSQLSGGQQQRVSIARALMNGGNIILADEPTGALDSQSGAEVVTLLKNLARQGHTVIIITHDPALAEHADRVVEFRDGQVISDRRTVDEELPAPGNTRLRDMFLNRRIASPLVGIGEAIRMAMSSLTSNVFRTFLTLLGIVIGVASVVAMMAIGQGASQMIVDQISSIGTNMLTLQPARIEGQRGPSPSTLTFDDADAITENVPNVIATLAEIQGSYTVRYGRQDYSSTVTANSANMPEIRNWPLSQGVYFTREDSDRYTAVAVLGATVADRMFPDGGNPLGEYILIRNVPFQVIGVLTRKGGSGFGGSDQDDAVFVPLKTGALRLFGQQFARSISVAVEDISRISETENTLVEFMTVRHGTQDFRVFNSAELLDTVSASQATFTMLLGAIGAISLVVGGIGVMNIMLVSVTERTREIGIRMATGARQSDILSQFLSEAIVVSAVGGVLGIAVGIGIGLLLRVVGAPVEFTTAPIVVAFCCAAGIGLIFGFTPARKAARLDPVVALANE
ncbi:MAG: MacB family efflux pump subunit [Gammaproteobacteria bacterium]|nr:MacB family efflux pump subunit [Gammaproteobacteria bacterium]MDP2139783.1 MacB family efflux pump subunit [Gammaproteobacteria bacterium]MDP2346400.1 MacB family efflux pump subunit [Gammaproteobacteria bacterium]